MKSPIEVVCNSMKEVSAGDFVQYWSQFYKERTKYPNRVYIEILKNNKYLLKENIDWLFEWKKGNPWQGNRKLASIGKIEVSKVNTFREKITVNSSDIEEYYTYSKGLFPNGFVYRIFLFHISRPLEFPIIDEYVVAAYNYFTTDNMTTSPTGKNYQKYKKEYIEFFNTIHREAGLAENLQEKKLVDNALMAFGQFLKKYNAITPQEGIK